MIEVLRCKCCLKSVLGPKTGDCACLTFAIFSIPIWINNRINSLGHNMKVKIGWGSKVPLRNLLIKKQAYKQTKNPQWSWRVSPQVDLRHDKPETQQPWPNGVRLRLWPLEMGFQGELINTFPYLGEILVCLDTFCKGKIIQLESSRWNYSVKFLY